MYNLVLWNNFHIKKSNQIIVLKMILYQILQDMNETGIHNAATFGRTEELIDHLNSDPQQINERETVHNRTPLHIATLYNQVSKNVN